MNDSKFWDKLTRVITEDGGYMLPDNDDTQRWVVKSEDEWGNRHFDVIIEIRDPHEGELAGSMVV